MADAAEPTQQVESSEVSTEQAPEPQNVHELVQQHFKNIQENKAPEPETIPEESITEPEPSAEAEGAGEESDDLEAFVENFFASEPEQDSEDSEDAEDEEDETSEIEELGPKSKANQRIRKLNKRTKAAEAKAQELEASVAKLTEQTQKQAAVLKKAMAYLQNQGKQKQPQAAPQPEFDENDPVQRAFKNLEPLFEKKYGGKIQALEQELEARKAREQEALQQQQLVQTEAQLLEEVKPFRQQVFPGLPEDAYADTELGTAIDELLMTRMVGLNAPPQQAAAEMRNFVKSILQWGMRGAKERGKKLQSKPASPTVPRSAEPVKETNKTPMYSVQQLNSAGYGNTWEAARNGFKGLEKVEPAEGWL